MEERKLEKELNLCRVRGEDLRRELDMVYAEAYDIVEARFRELQSKEVELKERSFALEERAKKVEEAEAQLVDLERKSDGFRIEVEAKRKKLNFIKNQLKISQGESNAEEVRLSELRRSVEECEAEKVLKESELSEMVESCRKTNVELGWKGEVLAKMESELERYGADVSAGMESLSRTQTQMRQLDEEVERKTNDLTLVQNKLAECEKLFETSSSELFKTQHELECKREQLGQMEADLERHHVKVIAEKELWERTQTQSKELEEEIERKRKDLTMVLDKIAECGTQLESVEEQLDCQQKLLETRSSELVSKEKELQARSLDIDLREEMVMSLNKDMEETCQQMESKAKELENVQTLIEERSAQCESFKLLIEEYSEELVCKEKRHDEITDVIRKLSLEIVFQEKTLARAQVFIKKLSEKQDSAEKELDWTEKKLDSSRRHLKRCIAKRKSKKKELRSVKDKYREYLEDLDNTEKELKSVQSILTEINEQVEEGEKRMQHLNSSNEELNRELKLKQEEVSSINEDISECSGELEAKRKQRDQVQSSLTDLIAEHKSKESQLNSVKKKLQDGLKDLQSKEEEQVKLKASSMEREQRLELKEKELGAREERNNKKDQQFKSTEQKLAKSSKKTELKAKKQGNTVQQVDLVRDANVCDEKTLQLLLRGHLKKHDQLHFDVLSSLKGSSDPAKLVLDTINGLYSAHQRTSVTNLDPKSVQRSSICLLECLMVMSPKPTTEVQGEAIKFATEWKNTSLVNAENPVEVLEFLNFLAAFSLTYTFDADQVQSLFDVAFLHEYGQSLCKALGVSALAPVNNVLSLEDKPQQPPEVPVINSSDPCSSDFQQSIASSHLPSEDTIRDFEDSTSFSPDEVSTKLPTLKYPGRFVLNAVEDALKDARLRGELSLGGPILMTLVPLLEELTRVVRSTDTRLQSDATRVANRWVRMMGASVEKLQLETWAFLQFIVAFGLVVKLTRQNQALQFAPRVAHFKQAPKLFESLGLSHAIPNFVTQLLDKAMYIPAIRFMFYFNVENNFSPLEFLKEQIINLRRSAKEERRYEPQAEANKDAATLRDIMELIEDFKLEIDIPLDLILKFMVPREIQIQNQRVVSSSGPVQSTDLQASDTIFQSSCVSTHGSEPSLPTRFDAAPNQPDNLETYQVGGLTEFQGQSSHHAGFKRPRVDPEGPRLVIRPCFNPTPGFGRF